jgi:hypothetical protein
LLAALRDARTERIGILSGWGSLACWRGADLATVLTSDEPLERDERLLLLGLLAKCVHIDAAAEDLDPTVSVDAGPAFDSYGIALVHAGLVAAPARASAVVSLAHCRGGGNHSVSCAGIEVDACFVVDFVDERLFWRLVYVVEDVAESRFFDLAVRAFPDLLFADSLTFRRFEGAYADVRDDVVLHLGALNDGWTTVYVQEAGNSDRISARLGIALSRESARTRAGEALMRLRDVEFEGRMYRCEWHTKLEPHRNRIHFHPADNSISRPLIGLFVNHLDTEG